MQSNVQTVLEGLGLVENKTATQDAAALKEVKYALIDDITSSCLHHALLHCHLVFMLHCLARIKLTMPAVRAESKTSLQVQSILKPTHGVTWPSGKPENEGGYGAIFLDN